MGKQNALRIIGLGLTGAILAACVFGPRTRAVATEKAKPKVNYALGYTPDDLAAFSKRFQADVWPLLTRKDANCALCHTANNPSQLRLTDAEHDFKLLLTDGHFDAESPSGLLARVVAPDGPTRMPPAPMKRWSDADVAVLRAFVNDLYAKKQQGGPSPDEQYPDALLAPYKGPAATGADNTFLTFYQLQGKVKAIFNDDWKRDEHDLFTENLAQFGGADFVRSFNESAKPTAQFLSGVDALSRDVASRAYLASTGPFAGRAQSLPTPLTLPAPDAAYRREINRLYQRMLFRDATPGEMRTSFQFLQNIYRAQKNIGAQDYELRFALTAKDDNGLATSQNFSLKVVNDGYGLGQTIVNENDNEGADPKTHVVRRALDGPFTFRANDPEQRVTVSNVNTHGNVMVHGIEVRGPLPDGPTRVITIKDPTVEAQGAWKQTEDKGVPCYEDGNDNKGASSLSLPVGVKEDGSYQLALLWRESDAPAPPPTAAPATAAGKAATTDKAAVGKTAATDKVAPAVKKTRRRKVKGENADNVLVEVQSHSRHKLALPELTPTPPKGEAHFAIDMSDDTVSFRDLRTTFRFAADDGVEISNTATRNRVVADAVRFAPMTVPGVKIASTGAATIVVPAKEAAGQEAWKEYQKGEYTFYRPVGPRVVTDDNDGATKGKLKLFYKPASKQTNWKPETFYRVEVGYPGAVENETAVPIVVRAQASSPIVRLAYPVHAHVGANVELDASGSYNLQSSPLHYTWRQAGGAFVKIADPHAAKLTFVAPALTPQQAAWEGLCRALMKHPDFLFTRPLSLAATKDPQTRRKLQLVKIAQDLVGRTPSDSELARLNQGASLPSLVDYYLGTQEFADYYYRRVRLYLESHGTEEDDEPARLWSWIANNDRPYKEILTADYTIDPKWQKTSRPEYHGKSGVLTMKGFIKGKPGLPHFNYAAQVCQKFLGYVFEVPAEIVAMRDGITAASTTSPSSVCYSCHKILTPLAYQRSHWTDEGVYKAKGDDGKTLDDSDHQLVPTYAFRGNGMEAFATQVQNKERFLRTIMQTHFIFYFGREMRYDQDERGLYRRLWQTEKTNNYNIKGLIRALLTSKEYLDGSTSAAPANPKKLLSRPRHLAMR